MSTLGVFDICADIFRASAGVQRSGTSSSGSSTLGIALSSTLGGAASFSTLGWRAFSSLTRVVVQLFYG
jgi:hypothetical protein